MSIFISGITASVVFYIVMMFVIGIISAIFLNSKMRPTDTYETMMLALLVTLLAFLWPLTLSISPFYLLVHLLSKENENV